MKKILFFLGAATLFFSCSESSEEIPADKYATLTFEDADYKSEANYLGQSNWSSLIDSPEYGGELLYNFSDDVEDYNGYSEYEWYDGGNTELYSEILESWGSTAYWNGGIAVSNYYMAITEESQAGYMNQLSLPSADASGNAGYNGSSNFGVVTNGGYLAFADGVARQITELQVCATSYWMSGALYGGYDFPALGSSDYFTITASSVDEIGSVISSTEYHLAKDGEIAEGWNTWDLSVLGEVTKVTFSSVGSIENEWGSALPHYFAIDNVVVKM